MSVALYGADSTHSILRTFRLNVLSVEGLRTKRFSRSPKAFVQIKINTQTYKTCTTQRSANPVWDNEFFVVLVQENLIVDFFVFQHGSPDREVGRCALPVASLADPLNPHDPRVHDLQLTDTSGQPTLSTLRVLATEILSSSPKLARMEAVIQKAQLDALKIVPAERSLVAETPDADFLSPLAGIISSIAQLKPVVDRLAKVHPYADTAWRVLTLVYNAAMEQHAKDARVLDLVSTMADSYRFLTAANPLPKIDVLENAVTSILQLSSNCGVFIHWYTSNSFKRRAARDIMSDAEQRITDFESSFQTLTKNLSMALNIQTALVTSNLDRENNHKLIRDHLPCETATWDPTLTCQPGTREDIIRSILSWVNTRHDQNIFWLAGLAGSGKSTIAHTIAHTLASASRLGGCFFFARHLSDRNQSNTVVTTLAHALASFSDSIRNAIAEAISKNINVGKGPLRRQFLDLIVGPLKRYEGHETIVIVLDALDECATPALREDLLTILAHDSVQLPSFVRLFVTARPEFDIDAALANNPRCEKYQIKLDSESNLKDIMSYITTRMERIMSSKPQLGLPTGWPGDRRRADLVQHSAGLFVWASTACNFIKGSFRPDHALMRLLSGEVHASATAAIDALYATALAAVEGWQDDEFVAAYQAVVGAVVALKNPLPPHVIDILLSSELRGITVEHVLSSLGCVIACSPGEKIRVLHPSFADYLTSPTRCKDAKTHIDVTIQHRRLATCCLSRMGRILKYNVCNLNDGLLTGANVPDFRQLVNTHVPEDVQYACRFWAEHVVGFAPDQGMARQVHRLMTAHALHWMEVMSLLSSHGDIGYCLHVLRMWAQDAGHAELASFVYDLERFAQTFAAVMVPESTLHIYISALPFAPQNTTLHGMFVSKESPGLRLLSGADQQWAICTRTLEGHTNWVQSVAFSPDGKLASGSDDATVRVWDSLRGIPYLELEGHTGAVTSVAFSSNGGKIISGSKDGKAIIWDSSSGYLLASLEGHTLGVSSVAFSPDRTQAITGSIDTTIRLWDVSLGAPLGTPLEGHQEGVSSIAVSPEGDLIASGSHDRSLRVWSTRTQELVSGPLMHDSRITSVAFGRHGNTIACACWDGTVRLWDSAGTRLLHFKPSTRPISSVAFSQDDSVIGVASYDHSISLWDVAAGTPLAGPLHGHSEQVTSIAFSADGSIMASGSRDHSIRLWEILETKKAAMQSQYHKADITVISISQDGSQVASGASDGSICIWSAVDGRLVLGPFDGHSNAIATLSFSSDGQRLVSGSHDQTLIVWSTVTGDQILGPLEEHTHTVSASAFSPDGSKIASGGYDRCICLWDANSGELLGSPLEEQAHWIVELAFSNDGMSLRSIDYNGEELHWDLDTGETLTEPRSFDEFVTMASAECLKLEETGWLMDVRTKKRVCWIPADHRGEVQASRGDLFVVGNGVGLITMLDVAKIASST